MRLPHSLKQLPLFAAALLCTSLLSCKEQEKNIQGAIRITPELQTKISPTAALFVIARPEGTSSGPPLAVKRLPQPFSFPIDFSLSAQDAMMPDAPFSGRITVTARLSQSGAAVPATPGDIEGTAKPNPTEPGKGKVEIVLDRVRE